MKNILAIDDSKITLQSVRNTLGNKYKVIAITDGAAAINYLEKHTCDLILLDYEMPGMDGVTVFLTLRDDPRTADIPIVFLTGSNDTATVSQILAFRPNGYIIKPFVPDELVKRVEKIIG